jgi:ADP-ribosylglycohydrolase
MAATDPSAAAAQQALASVCDRLRPFRTMDVCGPKDGSSLNGYSIFDQTYEPTLTAAGDRAGRNLAIVEPLCAADVRMDRGVGCLVGMAVGDAVGAPLEFLDAVDPPHRQRSDHGGESTAASAGLPFDMRTGTYSIESNKFRLQRGQWTDDASMGLCLADSLLATGGAVLDGSDLRARFWCWWFQGYNNAFRLEAGRTGSVGLGGNIGKSLHYLKNGERPPPVYTPAGPGAGSDDAGNGSLMRLGAVALSFHADAGAARAAAAASSYATHPGPIAAEACSFLAFLLVRCINRGATSDDSAGAAAGSGRVREFLEKVAAEYLGTVLAARPADAPGVSEVQRLLRSAEPDDSRERNWNWRNDSLEVEATLVRRLETRPSQPAPHAKSRRFSCAALTRVVKGGCGGGGATQSGGGSPAQIGRPVQARYNGHPVSAGYFFSYCIDGLAVALHSVYHATDFSSAIERCVNFLGDADTTAAIAGQIAGALWGWQGIDARLKEQLLRWDDGEIALRAAALMAQARAQ